MDKFPSSVESNVKICNEKKLSNSLIVPIIVWIVNILDEKTKSFRTNEANEQTAYDQYPNYRSNSSDDNNNVQERSVEFARD